MLNKNRIILSAKQANKYSYENVLNYNCIIGGSKSFSSKWDPAKNTVFADIHTIIADYYVDPNIDRQNDKWFKTVQGAVDQAVRDVEINTNEKRQIYIELGPAAHHGLVYIPKLIRNGLTVPITIFSRQDDSKTTTICANIDAEMSGREYALKFEKQFATSPQSVKSIFERICKQKKITTANASVLRIENNEFRGFNFTIQNTYNANRAPENKTDTELADMPRNKAGQFRQGQHQAVAVQVAGADKVHLENLRLLSLQDTLYLQAPITAGEVPDKTARTYIRNCYIEGDVDFIFGQAIGYFSACKIRTLNTRAQKTWIAAPATNIGSKYGFVFDDCDFLPDKNNAVQNGSLSFGRQWFEGVRATPYGTSPIKNYSCELANVSSFNSPNGKISRASLEAVGKCVIMNSRIDQSYNRLALWDDWNGGEFTADGTYLPSDWHPRFRPVQHNAIQFISNLKNWQPFKNLNYSDLVLEDVFLAEYNNYYAPHETL